MVDSIERHVADERIQIVQNRCVSRDRLLRRIFGKVLLNRISKGPLRPFSVDSDLAEFAQAMYQVSLGFLAVRSAGAFT
jgi:hypothetical protein